MHIVQIDEELLQYGSSDGAQHLVYPSRGIWTKWYEHTTNYRCRYYTLHR